MAKTIGGEFLANDGSVESQKFLLEHGEHLKALGSAIGKGMKD